MKRLAVLLLVGALLLVAVPANAEPMTDDATLDRVVEFLEAERVRLGIPGMAVAIVDGSDVVLLEGLGEGSDGVPATPDTSFLINSVAKSVTAVALAQLIEEGAVALDTPVAQVIPELSPGGDQVTIEDLLHHSSGLSDYAATASLEDDMATLEETVPRLEPLFGEVDGFEYTNGAYDTLALVVERISGLPFEDYVAAEVFEPLGMASSVVGRSGADLTGAAQGHYEWLLLGPRPHDDLLGPGEELGGQIMYSTARDMAAYLSAHMAGSLGPEEILYRGVLVNPEWGREYAGGLWWEPPSDQGPSAFNGFAYIYHDGGSPTHRSLITFSQDLDFGIVLLANWNDITDELWIGPLSANVRYILSGEDPIEFPSFADPFIRWSKWITLGIVGAQVLLVVAVLPAVRRRRRRELVGPGGWAAIAAASLVDLVALGYLLIVPKYVAEVPLSSIAELPDYRLMLWAMTAALVWGAIRTVLIFRGRPARNDAVTAAE